MADSVDLSAWFAVDWGTIQKIKRTEAYFSKPTAGHAYRLEYSQVGNNWKACGGHCDIRIQSPHVDTFSVKARFLRLTFLKRTSGLWEFKMYY